MKFNFKSKKKYFLIASIIFIALFVVGRVGALNGWWGGGGTIPEDTFTKDLTAYWSFNEGVSQTAYDSSDNGNNGRLGSSTDPDTNDPTWITGKKGGALEYDGSNDYVYLPKLLEAGKSWAIEFWINAEDLDRTDATVAYSSAATGYFNLWINEDGGDAPLLITTRSSDTNELFSWGVGSMGADVWHHVVFVYDYPGAKAYAYLDGNLITESDDTRTGKAFGFSTTNLGGGNMTNPFKGETDEFRIYYRTLSTAEIRYHYNRGGPVAQWRFNEGNGQIAYDSTENNNDGQLGSAPGSDTNDPTWVTGKHGSALDFDGNDNYVEVTGSSSLKPSETFTLESWIKVNIAAGAREVISMGDSYAIRVEGNDGNINCFFHNGVTWLGLTTVGVDVIDNKWHYIVCNKSTTGMEVFVDGTSRASDSLTGNISYALGPNFQIGRHGNGGTNYFKGTIDEIRIYNYTRTSGEIRLDYNAGFAARFGPTSSCDEDPGSCMTQGLVGYWTMDEGVGQTAYDASDNGNNGTLTNSPSWTKGKIGTALEFDSSNNEAVSISDSESLRLGKYWSAEFWAYQTDAVGYNVVLYKDDSLAVRCESNGNLHVAGAGWFAWDDTGVDIPPNKWTHVIVTVTESGSDNVKAYKNGKLEGTLTKTTTDPTTFDTLRISSNSSNYGFDGTLDEVRIYNRPLSATEVRYHYNRGGPVAQWRFNEGNGQIAYDSTENNNDGQLGSAPGSDTNDPTWVTGKHGSALEFDGSNDYVEVTDSSSLDITNEITIDTWAKDPPRVIFSDGFESGDFSAWTNTITTSGETANVVTTDPYNGIYHADFQCDGSSSGEVARSIKNIADRGLLYARGYFQIKTALPANDKYYSLITFKDTFNWQNLAQAEIANDAGTVKWRLQYYNGTTVEYVYASSGPSLDTWYSVELYWKRHATNGEAKLWINGSELASATNKNTAGYAKCDLIYFGETWSNYPTAHGVYADYFTLSDSYIGLGKTILSKGQDAYALEMSEGGFIFGYINNTEISAYVSTPTNWHHYALTYDGSNQKLYIDGSLANSSSLTGSIAVNTTDLMMGEYFSGAIDEVRIYDYARTSDEIRLDYNAGFAARFGPTSSCDEDPGSCMTQGLVGYWTMDEGFGQTAYDASDYGNNGTLYSSPAWVTGKLGASLSFEGNNGYVEVTNLAVNTTGGAKNTVELWMYWNGNWGIMPFGWEQTYDLYFDADCFGFNTGDSDVYGISSTGLANSWHHVVAIFYNGVPSSTDNSLYIDGVKQNISQCSGSTTASKSVTSTAHISGWAYGSSFYFDGPIDEVRIYNRVLSDPEVRYHYNRGGPVAQWRFNEGNGQTNYDSTWNNNDGTIYGATWTTGKFGSALNFDGDNDYVSIPNSESLQKFADKITVETWAKPNFNPGAGPRRILVKGGTEDYTLHFDNWGIGFNIQTYTGSGWVGANKTTYTQGNWYHIVGTYNGSIVEIYVNGHLMDSKNWSGDLNETDSPLFLGTRIDGSQDFNGIIDEVRIYNYVRNTSQILQDYNNGLGIHFK